MRPTDRAPTFDECEPPEVPCLQDAYHALVLEENVRLALQCVPIHRPQTPPEPMLNQGPAVIGIVHMVIIDRREPNQQRGSADERPRARRLSADLLGIAP